MPDVPDEAVRAALAARADLLSDRPYPMVLSEETLTRLMLEAAAPAMANHVAGAILAHMEAREPKTRLLGGTPAYQDRRRAWRRYLRTAAQVASLAFYTAEDVKRLAAEALARGDYLACPAPEDDHGHPQ